jgi:hypothetical protein
MSPRAFGLVVSSALLFVAGCKGEQERGSPPPPPPAARPAACSSGGGTLSDAQTAPFFPRTMGGYCLDPNGGDKTYGEGGTLPIDGICDMFDGECEIYKGFGVRRVNELRYVDGSGSPATIDVHLSKFGTTEGAYAMFTKRVVGDGDPAGEDVPRSIEGGGQAALGLGTAYLWRGLYLAEVTYSDESAAEPAIKAAGDKLLAPLVKEIGGKLPGEAALPPAAAALPKEHLLPLGIRLVTKDLLDITGIGAGAFGYYKDGDKRWRVAMLVRSDADQAKDVLATLGKQSGASREKNVGDGAVRFMHKDGDGPAIEWVFARTGSKLIGVGDEVRALRSGMSADEVAKISLSKDDKIARLKKLIAP